MAEIDPKTWLEQWSGENIQTAQHVDDKGELADEARQCVDEGAAEGFSIAELKEAAGGDIETYLMDAQNAFTDGEVERKD